MALFNGSIGQRNHFAELQELIDAFRQNYLDTARIYFDPNPPYQAHAFPPSEFPHPPIISIVLGEICYNLRSALDYLIYELAAYDAKAPKMALSFSSVIRHRYSRGTKLPSLKDSAPSMSQESSSCSRITDATG
jgi:hypothetical protein